MNMLIKACFASSLFCLMGNVLAGPTIELKDGSRIQGDIQGIEHGAYIVTSPSLGTVHIAQSNIARILYSGESASAADAPGKTSATNQRMADDIQQLQAQLAQDPATMQSIMSLQSDPQIEAVLNDPAITKAIQDGDYASLMSNAKIQSLENNPRVRQLLQQPSH